jgi:hypothetical protein
MADYPARRGYEPPGDETGWGSPMPAEYGSLTAFFPPLEETSPDEPKLRRRVQARPRGSEPRDGTTTAPDGAAVIPASESPPGGRAATDREPMIDRGRSYRRTPAAPTIPAPAGTAPTVPGPVISRPQAPEEPPAAEESLDGDTDLSRRQRRRKERAQWAQSRRRVRHLDVWTVAKVSFVFYLLILVAVVAASVMLWYVANAVGSIQSIEKSVKTLFDLSKFTLHPKSVAIYTSIGGGILAITGTIANILAALMYNLISDLVGGIRFDVVDDVR